MNDDMKLIVDIKAQLVWREPPKDEQEKMLRSVANAQASKAADELRESVTLLVAILLAKR